MLCELAGQNEPDRGLDLPRRDGRLLVVPSQAGGLSGNLLENVIDERVHNGHCLTADSGVGMHLLEDLVDVNLVGLSL